MKNKYFYTTAAMFIALVIGLASCQKETVSTNSEMKSGSSSIELLINDADKSYKEMSYQEGDENLSFYVENDGLPEAYTLVETDLDDAGYKRGYVKRHFKCLVSLNLSDTQITDLRQIVRDYEDCKFQDLRDHRDTLHSLIRIKESARRDLVDSFRNGNMTKGDFKKAMNDVKKDFHMGIKGIRLNHSQHLRTCYKMFLTELQMILTQQQWDAFLDCYK